MSYTQRWDGTLCTRWQVCLLVCTDFSLSEWLCVTSTGCMGTSMEECVAVSIHTQAFTNSIPDHEGTQTEHILKKAISQGWGLYQTHTDWPGWTR